VGLVLPKLLANGGGHLVRYAHPSFAVQSLEVSP
jgi:hypothetical protein